MKLPRVRLHGCPHRPTVKQWQALGANAPRELLFGGAAGGGKSDYLLMAALQFIHCPGYSAIIFRRTFPQLSAPEDGLLARAQEWLAPQAAFEGIDTVTGMPTRWKYRGGGTLSFSHMQHERDKYNHQGPSYQFIGWDELTQFTQSQYLYLLSRLRKPSDTEDRPWWSLVPLRMRAASNPGGEGHEWVRERFPIPRTNPDGSQQLRPQDGRAFLPSMLADNPYLDAEEYRSTLMELHPYERAQLLNGDWDVRKPGSRFKREWFVILDAPPTNVKRKLRYWDLAATEPKPGNDPDWTSGSLMSETSNGVAPRYVLEHVARFRCSPGEVDRRIRHQAEVDGPTVAVRIEQEGGASGKIAAAHFARLLSGFDVRSIPSTGDKVVRSNPFASQAEAGNVGMVRGDWLEEVLRIYESFPQPGVHDDDVDSGSGAFNALASNGVSWDDLYPETGEEATA